MTTLRKPSVDEISEVLRTGDFQQLISSVEYELLECKGAIYDLKKNFGKVELAKDVSALANAKGGYLLLGLATTSSPLHRGDEITGVSCFTQNLCDLDQYRKILQSSVYPPIPDLRLEWHPSASDRSRGIVSIQVTANGCEDRPYLCHQVQAGETITGTLLGYFERVGDTVESMTVHVLRERLKDGMRYKDIDRRLETIEALLAQQAIKAAESRGTISWEQLVQRVGEAMVAAGLGNKSSFFLAAAPDEGAQFHGIFSSSQSPEVQLIDNPPKYREQGFDLDAGDPSRMVRAELIRRAAPGRKGLELWRDGSLIFVGSGDSNFLGWTQREDGASLLINNYVLTEVVCLFLWLTAKVLPLATPAPKTVRIYFGILGAQGREVELSPHPISREFPYISRGSKTEMAGKTFSTDFQLKNAVPEVEAFRLLKEIYNFFGYSDDKIPYVDRKSLPHQIDSKRF